MAGARRREVLRVLAAAPLLGTAHATSSIGPQWRPWPSSRHVPALRLPMLDATAWELAQVQGHAVVLNFWATWCEPCLAEMPSLQALHVHYRDRALQVVAVNFKESRDVVQRYMVALGLDFACLRDSYGEVSLAWGVHIFPTTVLIDRKGRPRWVVQGEVDWGDSSNRRKIVTLLEQV